MSTPHDESSSPETLSGELLRALRTEVGLSQERAKRAAGVSQSSLSRAQTGAARPTPELVRAVLETYGERKGSSLTPDRVDALVAQAQRMAAELVDVRVVLQAGAAHHFQHRIREMERRATLVRSFHPSVIIGNLQTRALAGAVFAPDDMLDAADAAQAVDARMERGELLHDQGRRWQMIQTEQAIRWPVPDHQLHADQLDHIADIAAQSNVSFRVIPLDTIAPTTAPVNGFHIYDDDQVLVGTENGSTVIEDPAMIRMYAERHDQLAQLTLSDEDSVALVRNLAEGYRRRAKDGLGGVPEHRRRTTCSE